VRLADSERTDTLARVEGTTKGMIQIRSSIIYQEENELWGSQALR
jgi:hypothetical protein